MRLQLVTLNGVKFDKDVYQAILPTAAGDISVFNNHEPLVTVAVAGVITVVPEAGVLESQREYFATQGGIIEISGKEVRILVDEADHSEEIIESEAAQALKRAQDLKAEAKDKVSLDKAQALVDRETVRLKVAEIRRHKRPR